MGCPIAHDGTDETVTETTSIALPAIRDDAPWRQLQHPDQAVHVDDDTRVDLAYAIAGGTVEGRYLDAGREVRLIAFVDPHTGADRWAVDARKGLVRYLSDYDTADAASVVFDRFAAWLDLPGV